MTKLKELIKRKATLILGVSIVANLALIWRLTGAFDLVSSILYLLVGIALSMVLKFKRDGVSFFILGALTAIIYNGGGLLLGLFEASFVLLILAGLQQGIITYVLARIWGVLQ